MIPLGPSEAAGSSQTPQGTPFPSVSTFSGHMTEQPDAIPGIMQSVVRRMFNKTKARSMFSSFISIEDYFH